MAQPERVEISAQLAVAANATNATATATMSAAGTKNKWRITGWGASFSGAAVATPVASTVTISGTVITGGVSTNGDGWHVQLANPIESLADATPSIDVVAGGVGAIGRVYITGYLVPANY